jgi:hypothetical protein
MEDLNDVKIPLPKARLRMCKRLVLLGLGLMGGGLILATAFPGGNISALCLGLSAVGLTLFIVSGFYWSCDNETCS